MADRRRIPYLSVSFNHPKGVLTRRKLGGVGPHPHPQPALEERCAWNFRPIRNGTARVIGGHSALGRGKFLVYDRDFYVVVVRQRLLLENE